ncbi:MAG TPA: ABC transporter permease [Acidimicrobiia bacterium]|nr:ABC transporter permease [Acidimicrobiia bacterium]
MTGFLTGLRVELVTLTRSPNSLLALATMPLTTLVFLATVIHAGRSDLIGHALVAPVLMAQWAMALLVAGELIETERSLGTLELLVASPTSFPVLLSGRIAAVTAIGPLAFVEAWAVATIGFGIDVHVAHPLEFALVAVAGAFAAAGWATVLSAALVLAGPVYLLQNTLTFPFYVLAGVLVPVSFLPGALQWPSRGLFLWWSADLLRDAYDAAAVDHFAWRIAALVGLGTAGFILGYGLVSRSLATLRSSGRLSLT